MNATMTLFNEMLTLTTQLFYEQEDALLLRDRLREASTVLDVGCGNGAYLEAVQRSYPHLRCTGIESEEAVYRYAAGRSVSGLRFVHADYRDWMLDSEPYDIVIVRLMVPHLPSAEHFLGWLRSVTHSGSAVIVIDLDDAATGPVPFDGLPLFASLFLASRRPLLDRVPGSIADWFAQASKQAGFAADKRTYEIRPDDAGKKRLMHRYMETVTRLMHEGRLPEERKRELDLWLAEESSSYRAGMFALMLERT